MCEKIEVSGIPGYSGHYERVISNRSSDFAENFPTEITSYVWRRIPEFRSETNFIKSSFFDLTHYFLMNII